MGLKSQILQALGRNSPFVNVLPIPVLVNRAPETSDILPAGQLFIDTSTTPHTIYTSLGNGDFAEGGNEDATTSSFGIVQLATLSELQNGNAPAGAYVPTSNDVATVIQGVVVGAVPPAQEGQQGIAELATQAETDAGTNDTKIVTPLKLANFVGSGGVPGSFTDLTATGTVTFTGATGGINMTSATASDFGTTGAGIDLTLSSAAGRVVINGEEAADDAVRILSAAGGVDLNAALQVSINTSENSADSVEIISGGGMDLTATGAAGKDIDIVCTSGSINLTAGENVADSMVLTNKGFQVNTAGAAAQDISLTNTGGSINLEATENAALNIYLHANGGAGETIRLRSDQGTGANSIEMISDVGGVLVQAGLNNANAIYLHADAGTSETIKIHSDQGTAATSIQLTSDVGGVQVLSGLNNANAIYLHADAGTSETIKIHADQGTGVASLNLLSDVGGITLRSGLGSADAINIEANGNAAGGLDVDAGTAGVIVDTTGAISLDSAAASNFTVTGAFDLTANSTLGSVIITGGEAAVDAIQINASDAAGGIDINLGTGGITIDTTGAMSFDGAATSNFTVTGAAADATIQSVGGSVNLLASEAAANAVRIFASDAAGGIDVDCGSGGFLVDAAAGAISLDSALASNFTVTGAADLTLQSTAGAVNVISGEANADSINVTSAGGMNIVATGAAAKDIILTNTNGSMTLTAGESVSDAFNLTASGAASGMTLTAGTAGISLASGQKVKVTAYAATSGSPYTLLGTDYFLALDVTGGILTVTLPASPSTGRSVIISDAVGQSGANTITIDGNGKNISLAGTAAGTKTISTAYKAVGMVYNGTIWNAYSLV